MNGMKRTGAIVCALTMGWASLAAHAGAGETTLTEAAAPVRIGMVESLFRDVPKSLLLTMMQPFSAIMKTQTGVSGTLMPGGEFDRLGHMLASNQVQLGVMHGIEFAWLRLKHPELQPLMIAVNQSRHLHALLIVRGDAELEDFAGLEGATLAIPKGTREHCRIFLNKQCLECGKSPKKYFDKIATPATIEDALDDVVDGEVGAALVDGVALECYKRAKPGRFAKLKLLMESEIFPAGVVVFNPATLDEATQQRFRAGMINARNTAFGKQLLTMWKLTGFEPVPDDYEETLTNIVKYYPLPAPSTPSK